MAAGIWGKELPLYERFYVGGIYTIRGLGWGEAGPRDPETGEPIGGTTELIFNSEYIFPIISELRLKGVVFFDTGNSYEKFENFGKLRYTAGAGVRWISPMGPIRIEWGYNLNRSRMKNPAGLNLPLGHFFKNVIYKGYKRRKNEKRIYLCVYYLLLILVLHPFLHGG